MSISIVQGLKEKTFSTTDITLCRDRYYVLNFLLPWKVDVAIVLRPLKPRYSSTTLAPGAFDFTASIPLSLPPDVSYISLVPII